MEMEPGWMPGSFLFLWWLVLHELLAVWHELSLVPHELETSMPDPSFLYQ
ncbi:hypothetical protein LC085_09775 [Bacillus tianshenii]|nr:hypothetical protein [Bacillus tianshenii]MCA1320193.1 hypothetical protein [Bacillus tianshenii]